MPAHYSCRARARTACWGYGPRTTLHPCRTGTDTKPTVSCRVCIVFFSAVFRTAHPTRPIWPSIYLEGWEVCVGDYQKLIGNGDLLSYYLVNKRSLHIRSQGL